MTLNIAARKLANKSSFPMKCKAESSTFHSGTYSACSDDNENFEIMGCIGRIDLFSTSVMVWHEY